MGSLGYFNMKRPRLQVTGAKTYKQNSNPVSSPFYLSEQGYRLGAEALSSFRCKTRLMKEATY